MQSLFKFKAISVRYIKLMVSTKVTGVTLSVAFLYCCLDYPSYPANAIQMGQATWTIWAEGLSNEWLYFCFGIVCYSLQKQLMNALCN